ncbi:MAG: histidine phosphatase family protein [Myxococcota bacterium]
MHALLLGLSLLLPVLPGCVTPAPEQPGPAEQGDADDTLPCSFELDSADTVPLGPSTVVYAVRHAEKGEGADPDLTEAGKARADALVGVMDALPLVAVYATDLVRTQQTVAPTAEAHGLPIHIDLDPEEALAAHILASHVGESVLHAGHSYTLDDFMAALGVADPPTASGYGDLWRITIRADGTVTLETSCFGEMD